MTKVFIIAITFAFIFTACRKSGNQDVVVPEIEFTSLASHHMFNPGDTIYIRAIIRDNVNLHEATLKITNHETNAEMMIYQMNLHSLQEFTLDTFYTTKTTDLHDMHLELKVADHHQNKIKKEIHLQHIK